MRAKVQTQKVGREKGTNLFVGLVYDFAGA
jgi:hypothetical protein